MLTDHLFQQPNRPDVFAATIGLSRSHWTSVPSTCKKHEAQEIMKQYRFDVMPIIEKDGNVNRYFRSENWGDREHIVRHKITEEDTLYYLTHIRDVLQVMGEHRKTYFFLENETSILGLLTITHLNARPVYLFLYHTLLYLETEMSDWLNKVLGDEVVLHILQDLPGGDSEHGGLKQYREDRSLGIDNDIMEYLFLGDMFEIIRRKELYTRLSYKSLDQFEKHLRKLRQMRNTVAHPNRSLVKNIESISELWLSLQKLEELLERLAAAKSGAKPVKV